MVPKKSPKSSNFIFLLPLYNIAGATLSKGLNRGMGTILGGGLGCLAAALAQEVGGKIGHAIVVGFFVFIFGK